MKGLEYKSRDIKQRIYKALVKLHFGVLSAVLCPYLWRDVLALRRGDIHE